MALIASIRLEQVRDVKEKIGVLQKQYTSEINLSLQFQKQAMQKDAAQIESIMKMDDLETAKRDQDLHHQVIKIAQEIQQKNVLRRLNEERETRQ